MIAFFVAATLLLLAVLGLVLYPLLLKRDVRSEDLRGDVIALSRERLEELKRRKEAGEIPDAEYDAQARDLEAQLSDDLQSQDSPGNVQDNRGSAWIGIAVVVFVPVLSGLLYLTLGQPQALFPQGPSTAASTPDRTGGPATDSPSPEDVDAMVSQLADRLKKNPDDPEGWFMLGRSYMAMQRYGDAVEAFRKLRGLVGDAPDVLVREATAIAMQNGGSLGGEPRKLIQRALDTEPNHPQALWLAATAAYQAQNYETALDYYQRVRPMVQGEQRQQVDDRLSDLAEKGYGEAPPAPEETAPTAETASAVSMTVNVDLAPGMQSKLEGDETVFVFARAVNGPPMPLAVVRKSVSDLPLSVTLDDSQAMTPQFKLSGFDRVTVGARISGSGQPTAQPGDLEGYSEPVETDSTQTVDVTIDRVVSGN